jgi:hypothetical protein
MSQAARLPAYGAIGQQAQIVTVDLASVVANTAVDTAFTVPGSLVGDTVEVTPLGTWPAGLVMGPHRCLVAGTVQVRTGNVTVGNIDPASQDFKVVLNHIQP